MADSFQLKAIITAVDQLSGPLKGMSKNLKGFQRDTKNIMVNAAAMGTAIVSAFALPISQAMQFESTMADVRKVVNFDSPAQFKEMSEDILKLSTQLPMTADGIGQIVAAGGQAGIARNELKQFASDAVKMGIAFDQTAEESGQMMAQWRTAFKMTQSEVVGLSDKINYLGNTGPANAAKISDIVTRIGPLGEIAGVASGEIAAMGATIAGMGVESEVTATGIKNFLKALTSGASATKSQKVILKALKINPKTLAQQMQNDAKGAMLNVLRGLSKLPKAKQSAAMNMLFGSESAGAIAPLLTNLDLLSQNFDKVTDSQKYSGSMQKEYESRAATTANSVQLLKNQFTAASITIGDMFLPTIVKLTAKVQPLIERFRQFVKANPDAVKSAFKFGATLLGTATAFGVAKKALQTFESVMKMTTMGKLLALVVLAGGLIVSNWEQVGPIVKEVWGYIDGAAQAVGGWQNVLTALAIFMTTKWTADMLKSITSVSREMLGLKNNIPTKGGLLGKAGLYGAAAAMLYDPVNNVAESTVGKTGAGDWMKNHGLFFAKDWTPFFNREEMEKYQSGLDGKSSYAQNVGLTKVASTQPQQGEVKLSFENAPPGFRVAPAGKTLPWLDIDVGYSRFSGSQ
ncbi:MULTISPECIES: phage tail tape measure protein [Pantoea]|uniref:phage tail tape measure protein n=1 Tax=Pantoea TaxID=53335 RepID=UPI0006618133|nr:MULTISPECIES: phage tail tape measure protein [Pantoea]MDU2730521.1 phage tail tape measure protein [Pantoea sp.]MDU6090014.1 phage tail tape measure protein [Staphylococcus lugdunensis]